MPFFILFLKTPIYAVFVLVPRPIYLCGCLNRRVRDEGCNIKYKIYNL